VIGSPVKNYRRGQWAEQVVLEYLERKKLKLVSRNFHSKMGEIDLIMLEQETIVFIEVRYRANNNYLHALESINDKKCSRIIKTSQHYLQANRWTSGKPCRFDVITVTGENYSPKIEWIKNAFQA
jgi:putative endonuclease